MSVDVNDFSRIFAHYPLPSIYVLSLLSFGCSLYSPYSFTTPFNCKLK